MIYVLQSKQKNAYRSRRLATDSIDPVDLIRDISRDLSDPQPVDVFGWIDGGHDRSGTRSDENRIFLALESLSRPKVPDGRETGPGSALDEVVVGLDDFWGEQEGDDGGDFLDCDVGSQVDPSFVNGLLDRPEKVWRRMVQA